MKDQETINSSVYMQEEVYEDKEEANKSPETKEITE